MNNHKQACELGEAALSDALEKIDDVDEETFRDAKSIIELLKENLSLWKEEEEQNNVEDLWAQWSITKIENDFVVSFNEMLNILTVIWIIYLPFLSIVSCDVSILYSGWLIAG